jgi:Cys-tRNA(Pro)/Cys-tRNA(Cys) deacylase
MRLLRQAGVPFETASYEVDEDDLSGAHAAAELGVEPERVFKTLVARGEKTGINVFVIPVQEELDLKKAANAAGDKKLEMVHVKELFALTGYVRGGCSPVGMKKRYPTFVDETAILWDEIYVSAGQRGHQLVIGPPALIAFTDAEVRDLTRSA